MSSKLHAKYSASGSKQWLACPGSIPLSEFAPPQATSKWAEEGTQAHACLEYLVKNREKRLSAIAFLKKTYSTQMIIHAEAALNYIEKRLSELPGAELHVEVRADLPVSEPGQFGTTDIVITEHFGKLIVIDYKYGAGITVDVRENSQLIYYGLGVAHRFDYNFSEVELVIIQPRAAVGGETIRSWSTTIETLLEWRETFETGIKTCKDAAEYGPENYLKAGDHCRFCPAKVLCPEIKNKALRAAQTTFDDGDEAPIAPPAKYAKGLAVGDLSKILPSLDKLEVWIEAVREHAGSVLETGGKIEGYGLVPKRPQRKWTDERKVRIRAIKNFGDDALSPASLLSPAQLEKVSPEAEKFVKKWSVSVSSGVTLGKVEKPFDNETEVRNDSVKTEKKSRKKKEVAVFRGCNQDMDDPNEGCN